MEPVVSGIRYVGQSVEKLLLAIFSIPELTTTLGREFMSLPTFCTDIAHMASKEPPVAVSAFGDKASWFVQYVGRPRRAKQQFVTIC